MSRIRIVKGKITINTKGNHYMYSQGNITFNAKGFINETANNHTYGDPIDPPAPPVNKNIVDIIMFIAGTTDPINIKGEKHQANKSYWRDSQMNFWAKVKELKLQYLNLHIEDEFFSWSGDNNTEERNIAANRLLDLFTRVYPKFKNQETHLHLIGHSHGGNVINQFTELVATDKRFPKFWKIKSITYLSTPFFHKKHQLNHTKLHEKCQIINVHNEYDLTQRLIADFSLVNLEVFLRNFDIVNFKLGLEILESTDSNALKDNVLSFYMKEKEGIIVWKEMSKVFKGTNILTNEFIKYVQGINVNKPSLDNDRDQFVHILYKFLQWTYEVHINFNTRKSGYGKSALVKDLKLTQGVAVLNELFDIKRGVKDSYILHLLARLFTEKSGLTDSIEINSWSPKNQTRELRILDLNITKIDPYNSRGKKNKFENFITATSNALQNNNLEEVLMSLFSQFINPLNLLLITLAIDKIIEPLVFGSLDDEVTKLRKNLEVYSKLVSKYHENLILEDDKIIFKDSITRPGTIPYLAMISHGLSHTQFWPEVENGLRNAFSSGKNPGFKKK